MRTTLLAILLAFPCLVHARVLNVEFQFTPFTGDPAKDDHVRTVAGTARVQVNGIPYAQQPVESQEVPVLFEARELPPSVWIPVESVGPLLRKGKNTLRIEFEPKDAAAAYRAQLRWASVTDQVKEEEDAGSYRGTNMEGAGVDDKAAKGPLVFEREFQADFAKDEPWHHYPAVTALSDDDKTQLTALVSARATWFAPDFAKIYAALGAEPRIQVAEVRKAACLDAAWKAGVRVTPPPADQLEFATTGNPEVVVRRRRQDQLYTFDPKAFDRIKGDEAQMCAGMALGTVYPPRLVAVRTPDGTWKIVP